MYSFWNLIINMILISLGLDLNRLGIASNLLPVLVSLGCGLKDKEAQESQLKRGPCRHPGQWLGPIFWLKKNIKVAVGQGIGRGLAGAVLNSKLTCDSRPAADQPS